MSLIGMVRDYVKSEWWNEIQYDPSKREVIRGAAKAVLEAPDPDEEFRAILALRRAFPD